MTMDESRGTLFRVIAVVSWDDGPGKRQARNYGFWEPKDDMSHLEEVRGFVNAKHGGAPGIDVTIYMVEDVTESHPQQVSIAANSIGYALQEAGVEFTTESILNAAQRLADQGLLK